MRLNLGSGDLLLDDYANLDGKRGDKIYPLDGLDDGCCDEVRASHVLEHFSHREVLNVIREWTRVLKPGGLLKLAVPDFHYIATQYLAGDTDHTIGWTMGGHVDEWDHHGALFDEGCLSTMMETAGLVEIDHWESDAQDCSSLPVSLNLQGWKPTGQDPEEPIEEEPVPAGPITRSISIPHGAVTAIMSMPRVTWTANSFCCQRVFGPLGILLETRGGVFWDQAMTNLIEPHLADGTRYIVTVDYDTVFVKADLMRLLHLMETRPEIDALCSMQMRRDGESPLIAMGQYAQRDMPQTVKIPWDVLASDAMQVKTGHFGLTVLRASAFEGLAKPWFASIPDAEGAWGEGRMDSDIAFWHRWAEAGRTLYVANRVSVGHVQVVVSWPGARLDKAVHQYMTGYEAGGKPEGIWE